MYLTNHISGTEYMHLYNVYSHGKRKSEDSLDSIEPWHGGYSEHAEGSRMGVWLVALGTNQISYILKVSDEEREQQISMIPNHTTFSPLPSSL